MIFIFQDWLTKLEEGVRLPPTEMCPNFLYSRVLHTLKKIVHSFNNISQVMLSCWYKEPSARPTFRDLKILLKSAELEVT